MICYTFNIMIPNILISSNKNKGSSFVSPAHGCGGGVSAIPAKAGRQNRKIFVSLIEKNFRGARIKKCSENFSVLSAVRRAETRGGIQSAKSSGFCSKKVRISSNRHHQSYFLRCSWLLIMSSCSFNLSIALSIRSKPPVINSTNWFTDCWK